VQRTETVGPLLLFFFFLGGVFFFFFFFFRDPTTCVTNVDFFFFCFPYMKLENINVQGVAPLSKQSRWVRGLLEQCYLPHRKLSLRSKYGHVCRSGDL
jgi:hypothetical protein